MTSGERLTDFLALSAALTGFPVGRLRGTGQAARYLATLDDIAGGATADDLLDAYRGIAGSGEAEMAEGMRRAILSDERLGPLARNLVKLWYTGTWYQLPRDWREAYGSSAKDRSFVVAPEAYTEGLLWPAIGANPSGAKPFGYGMWVHPPRFETS